MSTAHYEVRISAKAQKEINRLPKKFRAKVEAAIAALADEPRPHGAIKLTAEESYRIRVGNYRIIYLIDDGRLLVMVVEVGDRKNIYRG